MEKLREAKRGEITFNEIVLKNHEKIYRLFRKMVETHEEADDLTQDTFIKAYKNFSKFRFQSSPYTWIYRIAVNTGINYLKKKKTTQFLRLENAENIQSDDRQNQQGMGNNPTLRKAISKLPSKQQMVIILRSYQELPFKEIAKIMDSTENAVKVNFSHALKNLRKILNEMGYNYEAM